MHKLIVNILILSSLFPMSYNASSQALTIKNVSVVNDQGHVNISWEYNGSDNLEIFRDSLEINNLSPIHTITNPAETSFLDVSAQAHLKPRTYKIQSKTASSVRSEVVYTYYLTFNYDSCLQQINLSWEKLEANFIEYDWTPSQFKVNIFEDGVLQTVNVDASLEDYIISGILENTNYGIFIETLWQGLPETSYSNSIRKFTLMPQSPEYINSISASADGNNTSLKFEIASNSELDTYKLLKSDSQSGNFDTLETIITTGYEITATDNNSDPDSKISFYKLVSVNECGNETTNSDIINNIVLEIENNEFENTLTWNEFKEGSLISVNYDIYRIVSNLEPELVGSFSNFNSFQNNIESLQNYSQFCYFVRAKEESLLDNNYSQSNTACVYLKPKVYIPEAFTPNDDGINDFFQPVFTFIPKEYELKVYNRWGNVIFETGDYTKAWYGKEPNGKSAPAGAYIYYLKIKSPNDQVVEERGSIIVIYP